MSLIQTISGGVTAYSGASGGKVRAFNNIAQVPAVLVLPANPSRISLTFHNPGVVDIFVFPQNDANGVPITPTNAALGGCFRIYANGATMSLNGECQQAWYAFSISGTLNPFTSMESNI